MTVDVLRKERARIDAELARLAGKPLLIQDESGIRRADTPKDGWMLRTFFAAWYHVRVEWYPTKEAAKAALLQLAQREGRVPSVDGLDVDLTVPGCGGSWARVRRAVDW